MERENKDASSSVFPSSCSVNVSYFICFFSKCKREDDASTIWNTTLGSLVYVPCAIVSVLSMTLYANWISSIESWNVVELQHDDARLFLRGGIPEIVCHLVCAAWKKTNNELV